MVKHVILWKLKPFTDENKKLQAKKLAKAELESLMGKIDGLVSLTVHIEGLDSSTADMMLDSVFTDVAALKGYQNDPAHIRVADNFVRPIVDTRLCLDFEE